MTKVMSILPCVIALLDVRKSIYQAPRYIYIYIYIYICIYMYTPIYIHTYIHTHVYMCIYIYTRIYIYIYIHMCISLSLYIYIYIYTHACYYSQREFLSRRRCKGFPSGIIRQTCSAIQRRLARPLRKDDTHKYRSVNRIPAVTTPK